jgi:hypothetical protein
MLNVATCHEKEGKVAAAWAEFSQVAVLARKEGRADRETMAQEHMKALEPRLPRLLIEVPQSNRVNGLQVTRNGSRLQQGAWGTGLPIDPGDVVIEASAPGYVSWKNTIAVKEGETSRISVPLLQPEPTPPPTPAGATTSPAPLAPGAEHPEGASSMKTTGLIVGAVGIAAVGVGSFFAYEAFHKHSQSNDACKLGPSQDQCDAHGMDLNDQSKTSARVADIGIGVGLVALVAGGYLYLTSEDSKAPSAASSTILSPQAHSRPVDLGLRVQSQGGYAVVSGRF